MSPIISLGYHWLGEGWNGRPFVADTEILTLPSARKDLRRRRQCAKKISRSLWERHEVWFSVGSPEDFVLLEAMEKEWMRVVN
jgi:hypothetical protein